MTHSADQGGAGSTDTIYAHSSGRPPAAIAVIRISGPKAWEAAEQLGGPLPAARKAAVRRLRNADGLVLDDALVLPFEAPRSATGEDVVELHCHGGRAVVEAVLSALARHPSLRAAAPGEFTRRAFFNGRLDLTEAEGLADLLEAETESQRRSALALLEGGLRRQVEQWSARITDLSARAEAAIDYVGDEDETGAAELGLADEAAEVRAEMLEWLARPRAEALKEGIRVVLAGPPNAGKSSLLNALVSSDKAIVTPVAGTTRDIIEVPVTLAGVPFTFVDTAGLRESGDEVERIGVERAEQQLRSADILLWMGEPEQAPHHPRLVRVHPRSDVPNRAPPSPASLPVSAVTGRGLSQLVGRLTEIAVTLLPPEGSVALNRRQALAIEECALELSRVTEDIVLTAEGFRHARASLDRLTGRAGVEDVLDALFGRFCLGK